MAIIGFIAVVLVAIYLTGISFSLLAAINAFGGAKSDRWALLFLFTLTAGAWALAYYNAPFHITFN
jgi:hypothetical protein